MEKREIETALEKPWSLTHKSSFCVNYPLLPVAKSEGSRHWSDSTDPPAGAAQCGVKPAVERACLANSAQSVAKPWGTSAVAVNKSSLVHCNDLSSSGLEPAPPLSLRRCALKPPRTPDVRPCRPMGDACPRSKRPRGWRFPYPFHRSSHASVTTRRSFCGFKSHEAIVK